MNKIGIKCINGESLAYSIDRELFELQITTLNLLKKVRDIKAWTGFFLFQLDKLKTRQAQLELIKGHINEHIN